MPSSALPRPDRTGILCVVSGPSGSGKTTLCRSAADGKTVYYTVSCTTRPQRPGEVHGRDYFFLTETDFREKIAAGEFLEHAEVHGRLYGTLKDEVLPRLASGLDVVMDLDTQGAALLRLCRDETIRSSLVDVFIMPESIDDLSGRLTNRRSAESAEELALRLHNARLEMQFWAEYDYTIISSTKEHDFGEFCAILSAERHRSRRLHLPALPDV